MLMERNIHVTHKLRCKIVLRYLPKMCLILCHYQVCQAGTIFSSIVILVSDSGFRNKSFIEFTGQMT